MGNSESGEESDEEMSISEEESSDDEYVELCYYKQLKDYKKAMQKLVEPTIDVGMDGEKRIYKYIDDDVKYGKKEFTVESNKQRCFVSRIKCIGDDVELRKKDGKCVIWDSSGSTIIDDVSGSFDNEYVEIGNVDMGDTKGQGNCTKAVAYMIKTLMIEAERKQWFPDKGKVHIHSDNACAALMCYLKAFMLNGYDYDENELDNFIDEIRKNSANYRFYKFNNKEQEKKRNTLKF